MATEVVHMAMRMGPLKELATSRREDLRAVQQATSPRPTHERALKANNAFYRSLVYKHEIRDLVLGPGTRTDNVDFHLEHVVLGEEDANYEALSYDTLHHRGYMPARELEPNVCTPTSSTCR